jgi:glutaredoxin
MKRVRLYGYDECPYCQELKKLYEKSNIEFTYIDIEDSENKKEFEKIMEIGKTDSVPIILVNKTILAPENSFKTINEALQLTNKFLNE